MNDWKYFWHVSAIFCAMWVVFFYYWDGKSRDFTTRKKKMLIAVRRWGVWLVCFYEVFTLPLFKPLSYLPSSRADGLYEYEWGVDAGSRWRERRRSLALENFKNYRYERVWYNALTKVIPPSRFEVMGKLATAATNHSLSIIWKLSDWLRLAAFISQAFIVRSNFFPPNYLLFIFSFVFNINFFY